METIIDECARQPQMFPPDFGGACHTVNGKALVRMFSTQEWVFDSLSNRNTTLNTRPDSHRFQAAYLNKLRHAMRLSFIVIEHIGAHIVLLLTRGFPSAIVGRIIAIIVNTAQGMLTRGAVAQVFVERGKARAPSFTDLDAASTVIGIADIVRVCTAGNHGFPRAIFYSHDFPMGLFRGSALASATYRFSVQQTCPKNDDGFLITDTLAKPTGFSRSAIGSTLDNPQFSKQLALHLQRCSHV